MPLTEVSLGIWHGTMPGVAAGHALRLPGRRPVGARAWACGSTPTSCCSTPTPGRSAASLAHDPAIFGYDVRSPGAPQPPRLRAVRPEGGRRARPAVRLGRRPAALHAVARHGHLRAARQGHDRPARPGARAPARHVRRAGDAAGDRLPARPRRDRGRAAARAAVRQRAARAAHAGWTNYWGYNTDRLLRAARRLLARPATAADRCASSRRW